MPAQPRPGAGAGHTRPAVSNRALVASVVACTVAIFVFDFLVMALLSGSLRTGGERAARAMPFISLAAVVVLVLLRRQLRHRQVMIGELQRSRLGAEHARRQLALVAQGTRALVTSPEDQTVALQALADAVVPEFADWCAVDLVEDGAVRRVGAAHAHGLDTRHPDLLDRHPGWASVVGRVMAGGRAELAWVGQPAPVHPDDGDHLAVMEVLELQSWMCVPLRIQGLSVGAISCGTAEDRRGFRPSDVAAAEELAARTGVAIERIALYRETQRAAEDAERRAEQLRRLVEVAVAVPSRPGVRDVAALVSEQACRVLDAGLGLVAVDAGDERITAAAGGAWGAEHDQLLAGAGEAELGAATPLRAGAGGAVWGLATRLGGRLGRPAGMLAVARPDGGGFTSDDESILVLLAQMASVAFDNAHLYETVRAREEHLRALVEAAPLAILEFGVDAGLRQANTAARELLGPAGDGPEAEAFHPVTAGVLRQVVGDTVAGAAVSGAEAVACRADGTEVALSLFGAALLDAAGGVEGVLVLAADVSARRRLEDQLVRARRIEAVGQVAGGVAHDFNNLLTVVLGHAALVAAGLPEGDPRRLDVDAISLAAERAAAITSQLLTISRGDVASPEEFDPRARLMRLKDTLRSLLPSPIELSVDVSPGQGLVRMSPAQFDQVVLNLILNGRDAMASAERGTLGVRLEEEAGAVVLSVTDSGSGMDPETADRCFEPFFTTKGGMRGTGLGLATVHSVVAGAGGEVGVETEPGVGTTFTVRLPRVAGPVAVPAPSPSSTAPSPSASPEPRRAGARGSERILVVENEDGLRRLAVEVLRSAGYVVTPAADGQAALEVVAREVPDLVVSDVVMPRMGGVELARRLGEEHPEVPVLFMTGYVDQTSRDGLQGAEVLIKPFLIEELVARVGEMLGRSRAGQGSKR